MLEENGILVGYMKFGACQLPYTPEIAPVLELHRLYVLKSHHGKKLGRRMMKHFMDTAKVKGAKAMLLGVWEGNVNAQRFYQHYGFTKVGEYNYWPIGKVIDREWVMQRIL